MNLLKNLKKILKKETSHEIISINQMISIPTRESFSQNKKMLDLIETYKMEYKSILSQFKYLTSLDIHSKELNQNMSMNIDLLLNIFLYSNEIKEFTLKDKIDYLVNCRKLNLYSVAISELEIEVTARIIALNEIYNERKAFMPRYKKNALINEINNLSVIVLLFTNKKLAIELEKKHYLTTAIYKTETKSNIKEEASLIKKKRNFLLNLTQTLFPQDNIKIREDEKHILEDIAEIEKMLEVYVYKHKNDAEDLKKQLEKVSESTIDITNKKEVLSFLKDLENKYLAFYHYGREYIAIEDLMQLYLLKFNVLVLSENGICETFVDDQTTEIELECYKGILEREIESFIKGESSLNNPKVIKMIINILKKNYNTIEVEEILTDKYLLNILLSMGSKESLIHLLKNFKVKKKDYGYFDFCDEIFEWEEELPLETICRLMLSQKVGYDAELYEYLQSDIYPDKEYYSLPEGLKSINYNVDSTVEEHWLRQATLLTLKKMREYMNNHYIICPSSLTRVKNGISFCKKVPVKSFIFCEGLEIYPNAFNNIEILKREENTIVYKNNDTKEIITSDLNCHINKKWGLENTAGYLTFLPNKNFSIEEYNSYEYGTTSLESGKKAILARRDSKTHLLSRAYVDVSTIYGDFCLQIEEKKNEYQLGPHIWLSLYHGHHDEIIDKLRNDFNWSEYGIFRTKYMKRNEFYQWMLGFVDNIWAHPFRNIWVYINENTTEFPIYSFNEYQGSGKRGVILADGKLKIKNMEEYLPDMFENIKVEEYEKISCTSKAYFGSPSEHIAILKKTSTKDLIILYKQKNRRTGSFDLKCSRCIDSRTEKKFTKEDFELIISTIESMPIKSNIKKFVINEIQTYISISFAKNNGIFIRNNSDTETFYLNLTNLFKQEDFDSLCNILEDTNTADLTEKLIENISQVFHISINDLLGSKCKIKFEEPKKAETKQLRYKK